VEKKFSRYAWSVLGFNLLVISWGALVRASKSGDGCGEHWPLCNGTVLPHAAQIATLIEFTHRVSTGIALVSVIAMAIWAFRAYPPGAVRKAAVASVILIFTEALLGAGLVLLGYVGANASLGRAVYLSAHLINTLLMLAAMALAAWWGAGHAPVQIAGHRAAARRIGIALAAALAIAITGSITALSDTLYPSTSLRAGWALDFSAAAPLWIRLRIFHPLIAVLACAYIVVAVLSMRTAASAARPWGMAVVLLAAAELVAGMVNLDLLAPIWMQLTHLLIADLLWIALVVFAAAALQPKAVPAMQRFQKPAA